MAQPDKILLSFVQGFSRRVIDLGREEGMHTQQGTLRKGSICRQIVEKVMYWRHHEVYSRILQREGLTLFGLVERALQDYAAKHGYLRKRG